MPPLSGHMSNCHETFCVTLPGWKEEARPTVELLWNTTEEPKLVYQPGVLVLRVYTTTFATISNTLKVTNDAGEAPARTI